MKDEIFSVLNIFVKYVFSAKVYGRRQQNL